MSRAWLVSGLVVLLIITTLFVGLPAASRGATASSPSPSSAPAASTVQITPTLADGTPVTNFNTGYTAQPYAPGQVYFTAYDPSDASAIVRINDQNATRDGLTNPVRTFSNVVMTGGYNYSWQWNIYFLLPLGLVYGGMWNLTITGTNGGFASANFTVHTFFLSATVAPTVVLPGESADLVWEAASTVNQAPYSHLTSISLAGTYQTSGGTFPLNNTIRPLGTAANGEISITAPTGALMPSTIALNLWALAGSGHGGSENESATPSFYVGQLGVPQIVLCSDAAGTCGVSQFVEGGPIYATISDSIFAFGYTAPAAGESVAITFLNGSARVGSIPGTPPTTLTLGDTGSVSIVTFADSPPFATATVGTNYLSATVSDTLIPAATNTAQAAFEIVPSSAVGFVQVRLDSGQYYGGDTATATWQVGSSNLTTTGAISPSLWFAVAASSGNVLGYSNITTTATQGTFQFGIPLTYTGLVFVGVQFENQTQSWTAVTEAMVDAPVILINPSEAVYSPGDTVTIGVTPEGQVLSGATLWESVMSSNGALVQTGQVSGGQFHINVPKPIAPASYTISVWGQTPQYGAIGTTAGTIREVNGLQLAVGVQTASSYSDGSYQPGETIQLGYSLQALGGATLPKEIELDIYTGAFFGLLGGAPIKTIQVTGSSGSVSITIPSHTPDGSQAFSAVASALGGCFNCSGALATFGLFVNSHPSAFNYELGAGSGLTVGWLILLAIVIVVAVLLFVLFRRRPSRPTMYMTPTAAGSATGTSSPSTTGTSPPEWRESDPSTPGSAESPPPMPGASSPPSPDVSSGGSGGL
jgi:hypothetical protein